MCLSSFYNNLTFDSFKPLRRNSSLHVTYLSITRSEFFRQKDARSPILKICFARSSIPKNFFARSPISKIFLQGHDKIDEFCKVTARSQTESIKPRGHIKIYEILQGHEIFAWPLRGQTFFTPLPGPHYFSQRRLCNYTPWEATVFCVKTHLIWKYTEEFSYFWLGTKECHGSACHLYGYFFQS